MNRIDEICEKLQLKSFGSIPFLKTVAEKTKLKVEYVMLILISLVMVFLVFTTIGVNILSCFFGMLVPSYFSFKAIKTKGDDDDRRWLTYWIVFGFFYSTKNVIAQVFFFLPLLDLVLTIVLFWLYVPSFNGYIIVYNYILSPVLNKFEDRIDYFLNTAKSHIEDIKKNK